jgi:glucose/arabinose dehydrogenase
MQKILSFVIMLFVCVAVYGKELPLNLLKLPQGFSISVYAVVPGARQMTLGAQGTVFVGTRDEGKIYAVVADKINPGKMHVITIASGMQMPNGVAFYQGDLFVADVNKILRYKNIETNLEHPPKPMIITDSLPNETHHGWRYIHFGPDGKLYIAIGAPCNNCIRDDHRFATIMRMDPDGNNQEIYAHGVRNSVGFDWHPVTKELWFTDNGRDRMGDVVPPDELNHATKKGMHFGFPYCHGKNISDPDLGDMFPCSTFTPSTVDLSPHAASLGMLFYTGNMFPKKYFHQIFIAQHGSWNRSVKIGYDVVTVNLSANTPKVEPFITGWLQHDKAWGRPVDILQLKDGSLLISDDYAGVIYRVISI